MKENRREEGLLVRAEPLQWAEEISHRIVDVERTKDDALLFDAEPELAEAIKRVLVTKGVRVNEIRMESTAERPSA